MEGRCEIPPKLYKQEVIREYAKQFSIGVLIETGTYLGHTVFAMKNQFRQILSIELDEDLYKRAKRRFAKSQHIQIFHGDSERILPMIVAAIACPSVFWLDAHYSEGITTRGHSRTPIMKELETILAHCAMMKHVLLIDDSRSFVGENDYPTITELEEYVESKRLGFQFEVRDDIIRIHI